jgi:CBS domain-containing protein
MSKDIQSATPDTPIKDAAVIMKSRDIGSLPVCEGRQVVGVITDRDITVRGVAEGRDPDVTRVRELMSTPIISVHEGSNIKEAERLMHDHQLRRLPVVDDQGELIGYLAMATIARVEKPEITGAVAHGVSQRSKPEPMNVPSRKRRRKAG